MEGLFGELDIANANENPFFKPDGSYECEISDANVKTSKKGNKGFAIDYLIVEGPKKGKKIQEWKPVPMPWELKGYHSKEAWEAQTFDSNYDEDQIKENAERNMSFLKQRLKNFGIADEDMNSITPEQLKNDVPRLTVTIKNQDSNERITNVKISEDVENSDPFA